MNFLNLCVTLEAPFARRSTFIATTIMRARGHNSILVCHSASFAHAY